MEKQDRRITRTRNLLQDALIELVLEKGYEPITIQEITDRANLGRATFYMHYKDKEDLLLTTLREGYQALVEQVDRVGDTPGRHFPLRVVFDYAAANRDLFLVLLHEAGKTEAYRQAHQFITGRVQRLMEQSRAALQVPAEVVSTYYAGALLSMVVWWLEQGMPYSSEEMENMLLVLFRSGINALRPKD